MPMIVNLSLEGDRDAVNLGHFFGNVAINYRLFVSIAIANTAIPSYRLDRGILGVRQTLKDVLT
ncbi:hypothetical protein D0962_14975 [Leptolyngbyaceae cyanobacterium CCMR0082]|uniref:Uncharacterized protein n=1 Tax=Adonisia turfae CCMR0082 TaxID=2304604 RepID=A0A6M0S6R4_9CYAN|nr:hypothetical protein [Adonisia turfae CCMR0082]